MVNSILVAASIKSIEELLKEREIPYKLDTNAAYDEYMNVWESSDIKALALRQARPAMKRIMSKEPYAFEKGGEPLFIRFNDKHRKLHKESFGEILLERPDRDWRITLSIKNNAIVPATMTVADRDAATYEERIVNVYNEIDDFGWRIFGVPCSKEYFEDVNAILERIEDRDRKSWRDKLSDEEFAYDRMITPMLTAIGREVGRICAGHPEAPQRLIDYFYGKYDYYYINPIDEIGVTRIGAVNAHKELGRIPDNTNMYTPGVDFPTELLEVRQASGRYGEMSKDTIRFNFDKGWALCLRLLVDEDADKGRDFVIDVYLPVTPYGSYRDQVAWEKEA